MTTTATPSLPPRYPVQDFFRKPERASYQLSDDGRYLAFLAPHLGRQNLHIQEVNDRLELIGEPLALTGETERDLSAYFWKGSRRLIYVKDFGGDENYHLLSVSVDPTVPARDLTPFERVRAMVVDDLEDDAEHVLVSHNARDPQVFDVLRINVETGEAQPLAENPGNITGWATDHEGKLRVAMATDGVNHTLLHRYTEDEAFQPLLSTNFKESVLPLFFTFDNQRLYVSSNRGRDKAALFELDPKTGREERLLFEHPDVDVAGLGYSRKRQVLTEMRYVTWKTQRHVVDDEVAAIYDDLEKQLQGYEVVLQSSTRDETRFVVAAFNDRSQGRRYLYDSRTGTLTLLGEIQPWLNEAHMAPMQAVRYTARDGLKINAYLTLPVGKEAKNLPLIVNPHGGPWARDNWGFNPEVQFLANRGYAVLQMNFRGSTGFGRAFWEASFKQWGLAMQDDITDGVQWLIREGIADPKRIAIYGGSYGGYATLAGITLTPDLYAAAVDYVGVSNLFTFMNTIPPYWKPFLEMMHEMVGHPERDKERMEQTSPVFLVDRIRTPLLVAQGAQDPRVNIDESDQIVNALRARGVEVDYLVKENEGHGFHNEENQFEFYQAMETFLARYLS
ncbi:MAG: S9 family peptidase [Pigmentiphaga sp.]